MLSYIEGKIKHKTENSLIILVQGLGYEVFVNAGILEKSNLNEQVELFLYQNIREDNVSLFGFIDHTTLNLFKKLLSVSGVGPKTALNILEIASADQIIASIQANDANLLTKVSGIGKKTAERVVLELKNKLDSIEFAGSLESQKTSNNTNDEIDALISLGYSANQAREAMNTVTDEISDIGERVKLALRYLGRK